MDEENYRHLEDYLAGAPPLLEGRTILVCGRADGLWRSSAEWLHGQGATVLLAAPDQRALSQTAGPLDRVHVCRADLAEEAGTDAIIRAVDEHVGRRRLDGVLINPGESALVGDFALNMDDEAWWEAFRQAVAGPARLLDPLTPRMPDGSAILFVVSPLACEPGMSDDGPSIASRALVSLVARLHEKLCPLLRVNGLMPSEHVATAEPSTTAEAAVAACYLLSDSFLASGSVMRVERGLISPVPFGP